MNSPRLLLPMLLLAVGAAHAVDENARGRPSRSDAATYAKSADCILAIPRGNDRCRCKSDGDRYAMVCPGSGGTGPSRPGSNSHAVQRADQATATKSQRVDTASDKQKATGKVSPAAK